MKLQSGRGRSQGRGELPLDGLSCLAGQRVSGVMGRAKGNKLDGSRFFFLTLAMTAKSTAWEFHSQKTMR